MMRKKKVHGMIENPILIIGGDHHNTLAVIRDLGKNKCNISVLVHGKYENVKMVRVAHSKYAKNVTYIIEEDENKVIEWILKYSKLKKKKVIIFPCSDFAAYVIDKNAKKLEKYCILPGFIEKPGRVAFLMDKLHQKEFADEYDIPMAKTWKISIENQINIPLDMIYPCIIKPELSATGNKSDIRICNSEVELKNALSEFKDKQYVDVLVQQFLLKKYEVCSYGCIINDKRKSVGGGNSEIA